MLYFYRILHFVVMLLLPPLHFLNPKVKKGFRLRLKQNGKWPWLNTEPNQRPIWFHCSSGEFEYALPVIRKIKEHKPKQKILVTYFTPSYLDRIRKEKLVDEFMPAPWDSSYVLKEFIQHHQPKCLMIARTDFWPEMIEQCKKANVPIKVFSMTFNKKLSGFKKIFMTSQFKKIDKFMVVSEEDQDLLSEYVPKSKILTLGDTRYEQCLYRLQKTKKLKVDTSRFQKPVFIAGSTWPEDESVLVPAMAQLKTEAHWIVVPHELDDAHIAALTNQLMRNDMKVELYTSIDSWDGNSVLVVNEFGLLAHLYSQVQFSFVGGSFKKQVHSVMESLACGCLTFVGPHYTNNREAVSFSKQEGFSLNPVQIINSENIHSSLTNGLKAWTSTDSEKLKKLIKDKAKAADKVYKQIEPLL